MPKDVKTTTISTPSLINKEDIVFKDPIGHGYFGVVFRATWKHPDGSEVPCAIKLLQQTPQQLIKEIVSLQKLRHDNIVQLYGVCLEEPLLMVLELCEGGSLSKRLRDKSKPPLLVTILQKYAIQVAEGMSYLESNRFVHRDLAARNVLLTNNEQVVKIADFGLSRHLTVEQSQYLMTEEKAKIPFPWCAPESLRYKEFSHQSDVWSYGVTVWEMFVYGKEEPWQGMNSIEVLRSLEEGRRLEKPLTCPYKIYDILLTCWEVLPRHRPNFDTISRKLKSFDFEYYDKNSHEPTRYEIPEGFVNPDTYIVIDTERHKKIYQNTYSGKFYLKLPDGSFVETQDFTSSDSIRVLPSLPSSPNNPRGPPVAPKPETLTKTNTIVTSDPRNEYVEETRPYIYHRPSLELPTKATPSSRSQARQRNQSLDDDCWESFKNWVIEHKKWVIGGSIGIILLIIIIIVIAVVAGHHKAENNNSTTTIHHSNTPSFTTLLPKTNGMGTSPNGLLTEPFPSTTPPNCEDEWSEYYVNSIGKTKCYKFFDGEYEFTSAENFCFGQNGHLISILDKDEENFITNSIINKSPSCIACTVWTGFKWKQDCCPNDDTYCQSNKCQGFGIKWACPTWTDGENPTYLGEYFKDFYAQCSNQTESCCVDTNDGNANCAELSPSGTMSPQFCTNTNNVICERLL